MSDIKLDPTQVEVLKSLYPIFKREVYERREQLTRIGRFGIGFNLGIMMLCFLFPVETGIPALKLYVSIAILILSSLMVYQMKQHRHRHLLAKQAVIQIEKALLLFEPGVYLPHETLYPKDWSGYQGSRKELTVTGSLLLIVAGLTLLTLWSV